MRMSRSVALFMLLVLLLSPVMAASNQQKVFSLDDDVYQAIQMLYISQGLSLPSTTGPYQPSRTCLDVGEAQTRSPERKPITTPIPPTLWEGRLGIEDSCNKSPC